MGDGDDIITELGIAQSCFSGRANSRYFKQKLNHLSTEKQRALVGEPELNTLPVHHAHCETMCMLSERPASYHNS